MGRPEDKLVRRKTMNRTTIDHAGATDSFRDRSNERVDKYTVKKKYLDKMSPFLKTPLKAEEENPEDDINPGDKTFQAKSLKMVRKREEMTRRSIEKLAKGPLDFIEKRLKTKRRT